jgi:hypothetical protein
MAKTKIIRLDREEETVLVNFGIIDFDLVKKSLIAFKAAIKANLNSNGEVTKMVNSLLSELEPETIELSAQKETLLIEGKDES